MPGSVLVETIVSVESDAQAVIDSVTALASDPAASAEAFGASASIDVGSISTSTLEPPAPPPSAPPKEGTFPWLWVGVAIGASVLLGITIAIIIWSAPRTKTLKYEAPPNQNAPPVPEPDTKEPAKAPVKTSRQLSYGRRSGMAAQQQLLRSTNNEEPAPYWWLSHQ